MRKLGRVKKKKGILHLSESMEVTQEKNELLTSRAVLEVSMNSFGINAPRNRFRICEGRVPASPNKEKKTKKCHAAIPSCIFTSNESVLWFFRPTHRALIETRLSLTWFWQFPLGFDCIINIPVELEEIIQIETRGVLLCDWHFPLEFQHLIGTGLDYFFPHRRKGSGSLFLPRALFHPFRECLHVSWYGIYDTSS